MPARVQLRIPKISSMSSMFPLSAWLCKVGKCTICRESVKVFDFKTREQIECYNICGVCAPCHTSIIEKELTNARS